MSKKNPYKYEIPEGMVACGGVLRSYPDSNQIQQLFQNFGNCRFVFNRYKATFDERYENNPDLKVPDKYGLKVVKQNYLIAKCFVNGTMNIRTTIKTCFCSQF